MARMRFLGDGFRELIHRLATQDRGQDIIEYALLTGAIGIVGVVAWSNIAGGIGSAYQGWDTGVQDLWEPTNPGAGS